MPVQNSQKIWTTVGSAGTVDEADVQKLKFNGGAVQLGQIVVVQNAPANALAVAGPVLQLFPRTSAVIRYNVTPVDALFEPSDAAKPAVGLQVGYLAMGGTIDVKLIEIDLTTASETLRLRLESRTFPPSQNYQVQSVGELSPTWACDFETKAYYIEATLSIPAILVGNVARINVIKLRFSGDVVVE